MIVWLNAAFGAGKTTTTRVLAEQSPGVRLFDPRERVALLVQQLTPISVACGRDRLAECGLRSRQDDHNASARRTVARRPALRSRDGRLHAPRQLGRPLDRRLPALAAVAPSGSGDRDRADAWTGEHLVCPQTVLDAEYFAEIRDGLQASGTTVFHVLLDAPADALRGRIHTSGEAVQWRLDHVDAYRAARHWILENADLVIDVSHLDPLSAASAVLVGAGLA